MTAIKRCALYTRKSSEEGLDQSFNSLDAQREACEAYVRSQASEGWRAIRARYDDGGYSGGSLERPALQRLLADIALGKVDVVVVYKIDRLTRALADFARIVELFDRHKASFVSVTQAFNTTTSMGRLTLNVLLSFAQFEREVTSERIRDKIAASKAKGMWMGGALPLGYDLPAAGSRALVINEGEAETVRLIFRTYLKLSSVHALERWLHDHGIRSKQRLTCAGKLIGGARFSRGALFHLLRNRAYLGMIVHKDKVHPGMHPAILDVDLFDAVRKRLDANTRRHAASRRRTVHAPLTGRIFDADGNPMSPTFSRGARGKLYRYYVSAPLQCGARRAQDDEAVRRVSAPALETRLAAIVERLLPRCDTDPLMLPSRIRLYADQLRVHLPLAHLTDIRAHLVPGEQIDPDASDPAQLILTVPMQVRVRGGRTWITGAIAPPTRPDPVLINALRQAHAMLARDACGMPILDTAPPSPYRRRLIRLAFLAPELQAAILVGRQPAGLTLAGLMATRMSLSWDEQQLKFGATAAQ